MGFGKARFNTNQGTRYFSLKKPERGETSHNHFYLLPAYGKLETSNKFFTYFANHFGYRGVNSEDPSADGPMRPFKCIREKDRKHDGMIKVECAACVKREEMLELKEALEVKLKEQGTSKEEIREATKEYSSWLMQFNLDKKFYFAAMNEDREFGILKLPWEAKDKLERLMKNLAKSDGIDEAVSVEGGVWFDFQRSGEGINTSYDVAAVEEKEKLPDGRILKSVKRDSLSEDEVKQALASLPELLDLPRVLSADQIQRLVDSDGTGEQVDAIMGIGQEKGTQERLRGSAKPAPVPEVRKQEETQLKGAPSQFTAALIQERLAKTEHKAPPPTSHAAPVVDEVAELRRKLAELEAKASAGAPPPAPAEVAPPPAAVETTPAPEAKFTPPPTAPGLGNPDDILKKWGFNPGAAAK